MTRTAHREDWQDRAACAGDDTDRWFSTNPAAAIEICRRCPVRPECLRDGLANETPATRYGTWGGLTTTQRVDLPTGRAAEALSTAELRELIDRIDIQTAPLIRKTEQPMPDTTPATEIPAADAIPAVAVAEPPAWQDAEKIPLGRLLKWADEHTDPEVRAQSEQAREAVTSLRKRFAADQELTAITNETELLEARLAELRARQQQLAPAKPKKRKPVDYPAAEVRAWAAENGYDCPPVGRVPKGVVDAWRAATQNKETADA
ncbi:WhiB family transcriptional regulator [Streptomyces sp. NPDC014776]|uniref:WhiB family transcriptional regulator n=1 Tax=unclassified Streptomyces TaxID=2593676 RepID=UPI0036FEF69A